jgi:ATP-dependent Clp protease ATP-binding subunit ClpA
MNSVCKFGWAELGRRSGKFARPLHRSPALREVFKQGAALASVDGGRLRTAHLVVALIEQWDPAVSSAVTKLGHDSFEVLRSLCGRLIEGFDVDAPEDEQDREALEKKDRKGKKDSALRRFGRDLTELAAKGALPPLIGRRAEMLKITQILL